MGHLYVVFKEVSTQFSPSFNWVTNFLHFYMELLKFFILEINPLLHI